MVKKYNLISHNQHFTLELYETVVLNSFNGCSMSIKTLNNKNLVLTLYNLEEASKNSSLSNVVPISSISHSKGENTSNISVGSEYKSIF